MKAFKKIISITLCLAMLLGSSIIAFSEGEESLDMDNYIKVGLYWGSNSKSSVTISSDYGFILYDQDGNKIQDIPDTTLTIDVSSAYLAHKEGRIFMSAAPDEDDRVITLQVGTTTKKYRDGIWLYENSGLRVINFVTLEHYVWGVVNREMSYVRPLEALKAQAICARTYVLYIKQTSGGHISYGFDVCATTDCQVYGGYASEHDITTQACKETEGLIMTYDGAPVYALFSANSGGGYTMSIYDAWGLENDKYPYLASVADPYTPEHKWETTYYFSEIRQRLISGLGLDLGEITKVEISDTNSFGAVTGILVTGTNGSRRVPRSQIMKVFNLKSTFFCIGDDAYNEIEKVESTPDTYYVLSASGVSSVNTSDVYITDGNSTVKMTVNKNATYSMTNDVCTDGYVYMRGIGFGHGIGMSQNGAIIMAKDYGMTYDQILKYYYTGITIEHR